MSKYAPYVHGVYNGFTVPGLVVNESVIGLPSIVDSKKGDK